MATIKYNGMELEEVTTPQIFDPPRKCVVWSDNIRPVERNVIAVLPKVSYPVIIEFDSTGIIQCQHCALLPDPPKPRRATNRELARWLAQGNGEWGISKFGVIDKAEIGWFYDTGYEKQTFQSNLRVRKWSDTEWHEPTVDYLGLEDK
jgi:hypothetical protein